jgi:hypothetical protein
MICAPTPTSSFRLPETPFGAFALCNFYFFGGLLGEGALAQLVIADVVKLCKRQNRCTPSQDTN